MVRRTKIIITVGPAVCTQEAVNALWNAGADVFRLNFSHGSHEEKNKWFQLINSLPHSSGRVPAILADLQGPKMRVGLLKNGSVPLEEGGKIHLTTKQITGDKDRISIDYKGLPGDVATGDKILLDDGHLELEVIEKNAHEILCRVITGGILKERKGINVPGVKLSVAGITDRDFQDIEYCLEKQVDFIALSFVRESGDINTIKEKISQKGAECKVLAKIERPEAVKNFDDILQAADGVMIARGDLGVEIGVEKVPLIQKEIIRKSNRAGKPVITATQMLESMISNHSPTRAETSDAANAILDGSDAVMLSGETAIGKFPTRAVHVLDRVARHIETIPDYTQRFSERHRYSGDPALSEAIGLTACQLAGTVRASAIIAFTRSGATAAIIAKFRPSIPIWAVTPAIKVQRELGLISGVYSLRVTLEGNTEEQIRSVEEVVLKTGALNTGDMVVIAMGCPVSASGKTNLIKVHRLGEENMNTLG